VASASRRCSSRTTVPTVGFIAAHARRSRCAMLSRHNNISLRPSKVRTAAEHARHLGLPPPRTTHGARRVVPENSSRCFGPKGPSTFGSRHREVPVSGKVLLRPERPALFGIGNDFRELLLQKAHFDPHARYSLAPKISSCPSPVLRVLRAESERTKSGKTFEKHSRSS
jgi:hypothetical protein